MASILSGRNPAWYYQGVGGASVHFTGNFWRLREIDFNERSVLGAIGGTNFADWPITYQELEPYYTRSTGDGCKGAPGRSIRRAPKPFPMPPMPIKSSGVLLEKGRKGDRLSSPAGTAGDTLAAAQRPSACINCGYCMGFGCEGKRQVLDIGGDDSASDRHRNCEIRANSAVFNLKTGASGKIDEVEYIDGDGNQRGQKARAVVLSANGAETSRLLLLSESSQNPDGLANSSGYVGRNLMLNAHAMVHAVFEHQLNDYKGVQVTRIVP